MHVPKRRNVRLPRCYVVWFERVVQRAAAAALCAWPMHRGLRGVVATGGGITRTWQKQNNHHASVPCPSARSGEGMRAGLGRALHFGHCNQTLHQVCPLPGSRQRARASIHWTKAAAQLHGEVHGTSWQLTPAVRRIGDMTCLALYARKLAFANDYSSRCLAVAMGAAVPNACNGAPRPLELVIPQCMRMTDHHAGRMVRLGGPERPPPHTHTPKKVCTAMLGRLGETPNARCLATRARQRSTRQSRKSVLQASVDPQRCMHGPGQLGVAHNSKEALV